jgi:hypothetical protein
MHPGNQQSVAAPHRPREDELPHPADASRSNLASALGVLSLSGFRWGECSWHNRTPAATYTDVRLVVLIGRRRAMLSNVEGTSTTPGSSTAENTQCFADARWSRTERRAAKPC